ncbi:MAG: phosphoribosylformylglycinamidine cyclo-ligase [Planctomycetes bacterium]|nr:phosphoribosylformylglycinamidine cyclo-ligase [Planctomycetota bacterium]
MARSTKRGLDYSKAGVDTSRADAFLDRLLEWVKRTAEFRPVVGRPIVDVGYYAAVLDIGRGIGLAVTTDGVGTKILVAELAEKYDTIGIDCVAMNVNDLICVGAEPIAMVDYLAVQDLDPEVASQIGKGLYDGCREAEISIPGGELAQLKEMIAGAREGSGIDLAGAAFGLVDVGEVNCGRACRPGDAVIGLRSTGLHSNGFTLARRVLLDQARLSLDTVLESVGRPLGEELLEPTHIYVREFKELKRQKVALHAILNITGEGLFNMARVDAPVGFVIDHLPEPQPIFDEIRARGNVPVEEMYRVFNMGIGFCFVVPRDEVNDALRVLAAFPMEANVIGRAVADREKKISVPAFDMIGKDGHFFRT